MKIKKLKQMQPNGQLSDYIDIGADAKNIDMENGNTIEEELDSLKTKNLNQDNSISDLQNKVKSLASGSPLVANSVSEMTDTSRIYVNTTNGHWYYYNGTNWSDGGVYQAAVDSNSIEFLIKTNDALDLQYDNEFNKNDVTLGYIPTGNVNSSTINDFSANANGFYFNKLIRVKKGDIIHSNLTWVVHRIYDKDGLLIQNFDNADKIHTITANNAYYMRIGAGNTSYIDRLIIRINKPILDSTVDNTQFPSLSIKLKNVEELEQKLKETGAYRINQFDVNNITTGKYLVSITGHSLPQFQDRDNSFVCNQIFKVESGDKIYCSTGWVTYNFYDENGIFISQKVDTNKTQTAPENCKYMMIGVTSLDTNYTTNMMLSINKELPKEYYPYSTIRFENDTTKQNYYLADKLYNEKKPVLLLNFDGWKESTFEKLLQYIIDKNIKFTLFNGNTDPEAELTNNLINYYNKGVNSGLMEVAGYTGQPWQTYEGTNNYKEQFEQLRNLYKYFDNRPFGDPTAMSYSHGRHTAITHDLLWKHGVKLARTTDNAIITLARDLFNINCYNVGDFNNDGTNTFINRCKSIIDTAILNNQNVSIMTHEIITSEIQGDWNVQESDIKAVIDYIGQKVSNNQLTCMTFTEFFFYYMLPHDLPIGTHVLSLESDGNYHEYVRVSNGYGWNEITNYKILD